MRRVLIIANLFHASPRIPGIVKYLSEFGWESLVLTPPIGEDPDSRLGPPNDFRTKFRLIETESYTSKQDVKDSVKRKIRQHSEKSYDVLRPLLGYLYGVFQDIFCYPDSDKLWFPIAVKSGNRVLENERIDALISSSSPVICHIVARDFRIRYKLPWIADLRDLWSENHNYRSTWIRRVFDRNLEFRTLKWADALVTVTPSWTEILKQLHKRESVYTVCNGFDPEKVRRDDDPVNEKFTITYTGPIYTGKQDPTNVLLAVKDLTNRHIIDSKDVQLTFYGAVNDPLNRQIQRLGMSEIAKQYGVVPREISIQKQRESQLLLLLNWEDQRGKGWHSLKIFEYMAARRPIIAVGGLGNDAIEKLITETKSGFYAKTIDDIKKIIVTYYSEFKTKGNISFGGDLVTISKYSHREMARLYSNILNHIVQ